MLGAIIGDIVGSRFEWVEENGTRGKDFALFTSSCKPTDDSFMTLAIAKAILLSKKDYSKLRRLAVECMRNVGREHANTGWGANFYRWLFSDNPKPYNSCGNGSAMRISPVAWVVDSEAELKELVLMVTDVTHNHPEGLKGAEAIALAIYLARIGKNKQEIRERLSQYYQILKDEGFTVKSHYGNYGYDFRGDWVTCQGSVPQAIIAFLESESFEDAIRNAISIGGDSDTIGAMSGSIAEAYYGVEINLEDKALTYLSDDLKNIYFAFNRIKKIRCV